MLDGEVNFLPTLATMQQLSTGMASPLMPECIVVAVHNTQRERDLRAPTLEGEHGGLRFANFLGEELIPHINSRFRTTPLRLLIGHSQGASFAAYVLATQPDLFRFYLAIDAPLHTTPGDRLL